MNAINQIKSSHYDVVVIGSGMGGMTSAAYLSTAGKKVLLVEQYGVLGGCSHVFRRKKQWEFEVGIHYLGDCGEGGHGHVPTILRSLGLDDRIEFLPMDKDGFDTIVYPDAQLRVPASWDQYLYNVIQLFPKEEKKLRSLIGILRAIGTSVNRSTTPASLGGVARLVRDSGTASPWAMLPFSVLLDRIGLSSKARCMLTPEFGAYCCPPSRAPVVLHAAFLNNFFMNGGWYPKGGGQVFAAHFADVIKTHGGEIRLSTAVDEILVEHKQVKGVRLSTGEVISAPIVVSNADIKRTFLQLIKPEHVSWVGRKRVQRYRMAAPFVNGYLGVDVDLRKGTPNTNYYSCPTWSEPDQLFKESEETQTMADIAKMSSRIPAYVHSSTTKDPENRHYAPEGCSSIEVMTLLPTPLPFLKEKEYWKNSEYQDFKEQTLETLIQRVEEVLPQVKGKILYKELSTPATQERYTWSTNGSAYGIEPNIWQFGPFRPKAKTEIQGLFLAGASTAWGPSVEGVMISGLHAASAILGRDLHTEIHSGKILVNRGLLTPVSADWDALKLSMKPVQRRKAVLDTNSSFK